MFRFILDCESEFESRGGWDLSLALFTEETSQQCGSEAKTMRT